MARLFASASSQYLEGTVVPISGYPYAFVAWVYPTSATADRQIIGLSNPSQPNDYSRIYFNDPADVISCDVTDAGIQNRADTTASPTQNAWNHVAGLQASGDARVFLNGGNKGTSSAFNPAFPTMTHVSVGRLNFSGGTIQYWDGRIAEAAIYDLSSYSGATDSDKLTTFETQVLPMLAAGYSPLCFPKGLAAYYPLGGLFGRNDRDHWRNGYNLTAGNSPTWADHPRTLYRGRRNRIFVPTAAGSSVSANQASEQNTAFSIGIAKSKPIALSTEQNTALAAQFTKSLAIAIATEQDSAFAVTQLAGVSVGQATEQDAAFSATWAKDLSIGLSSEQNTAFTFTTAKDLAIAVATEQDTALSVSPLFTITIAVGLASEQDNAFAATWTKALSVGLASEQDTAFVWTFTTGSAVEPLRPVYRPRAILVGADYRSQAAITGADYRSPSASTPDYRPRKPGEEVQ